MSPGDEPVYGERQTMVILDGNPMINPPLTASRPPHDASHVLAVEVREG